VRQREAARHQNGDQKEDQNGESNVHGVLLSHKPGRLGAVRASTKSRRWPAAFGWLSIAVGIKQRNSSGTCSVVPLHAIQGGAGAELAIADIG
jgi:hypothetical protein